MRGWPPVCPPSLSQRPPREPRTGPGPPHSHLGAMFPPDLLDSRQSVQPAPTPLRAACSAHCGSLTPHRLD